jgi:phosphoribosylaminoimidazole-succinocarboxamide synthase
VQIVQQTNIPGTEPMRGKVRDVYDLGDKLLIVATDRISAFDVVMANGIPYKGVVLTQISKFWFDFLAGRSSTMSFPTTYRIFPSHSPISDRSAQGPQHAREEGPGPAGRVRGARVPGGLGLEGIPAERHGLRREAPSGAEAVCQKLPEPIFTPATKAEQGQHDENISFEEAAKIIGSERATYVRDKSIEIFRRAGGTPRARA